MIKYVQLLFVIKQYDALARGCIFEFFSQRMFGLNFACFQRNLPSRHNDLFGHMLTIQLFLCAESTRDVVVRFRHMKYVWEIYETTHLVVWLSGELHR